MSNNACPPTRTILFVCLFVALIIFVFPPSSTKAILPGCQGGSSTSPIRPGSGDLLTSLNDNSSGAFQLPGRSVCGSRASISLSSSYASLKSLYFDQSKSASKIEHAGNAGEGGLSGYLNSSPPKNIVHITGDLGMSGNINGTNPAVVFVDGNLIFAAPMTQFTYGNNNSGVVFIVGGNVNVAPSVNRIDAFIITFGQFCSAGSYPCPVSATTSNQLLINGSVVALSSDSEKRPMFIRNLTSGNTLPAEDVVYQPKYLVILKDVFARDRQMWSELTDYTP